MASPPQLTADIRLDDLIEAIRRAHDEPLALPEAGTAP